MNSPGKLVDFSSVTSSKMNRKTKFGQRDPDKKPTNQTHTNNIEEVEAET